jgi:uncharacterized membrane protein (DUF485 family)
MGLNLESLLKTEEYKNLTKARYRLILPLLIITVVSYMSFILVIAFEPNLLAKPFGNSVISLGIVLGFSLILLIFLITFYYVFQANQRIEPLIAQIQIKSRENHHA